MKKLIVIALMLSFFAVNAQQGRQPNGPNGARETAQLSTYNHPGDHILVDLNKDRIRKTDNYTGHSIFIDTDRYEIAHPDYHPGYPIFTDSDRYSIAYPDYHPGGPVYGDPDKGEMKKTD